MVDGLRSNGLSLHCCFHSEDKCKRDLRFGQPNSMSIDECAKRLLRWERLGDICADKAEHKTFAGSTLLRDYASVSYGGIVADDDW